VPPPYLTAGLLYTIALLWTAGLAVICQLHVQQHLSVAQPAPAVCTCWMVPWSLGVVDSESTQLPPREPCSLPRHPRSADRCSVMCCVALDKAPIATRCKCYTYRVDQCNTCLAMMHHQRIASSNAYAHKHFASMPTAAAFNAALLLAVCPPGTYMNSDGNTCESCPVGAYCPGGSRTASRPTDNLGAAVTCAAAGDPGRDHNQVGESNKGQRLW